MNPMSTTQRTRTALSLLMLVGLGAAGCGEATDEPGGDEANCVGAKCDIAEGEGEGEGEGDDDDDDGGSSAYDEFPDDLAKTCSERKDEAFTEGRPAFSRDQLRWSCADVVGTHPDERGQEYCEYFAMVQRPGAEQTDLLGLLQELEPSTEEEAQVVEVTPSKLELTEDDIAWLESDPTAEAGRCVFTSWNADVDCDDCDEDLEVLGVRVSDPDVFRMKFDANTYDAAKLLVDDCMNYVVGVGDPDDPDDLFHDDFMRACELNSVINETEYRKSDNTVCAASMRLAECGCYLTLRLDIPTGLSPTGQLGFSLGNWESPDQLPAGCRYEDVAYGAQQIVTCSLTAAEVLDNAMELKSYCAERYADDVVVHVPVPAAAVRCDPDTDAEPYAHTCGDEVWNVEP